MSILQTVPRTFHRSSSIFRSKALIFLGENCAYDTEFFSLLAQKRNSGIPIVPFVVFNILMGLLDRVDTSVLESFLLGFDFIKKDGLVVLNPIALVNIGRIGQLTRLRAETSDDKSG
jgi:hypothetical protein